MKHFKAITTPYGSQIAVIVARLSVSNTITPCVAVASGNVVIYRITIVDG